jgi:uncharacterized membrane protein
MARDVSDVVRGALGNVAREALKNVGDVSPPTKGKSGGGPLSGAKGIAAGIGLAAAAPLAKKGVDAVRGNGKPSAGPGGLANLASTAGDRVGSKLKDAVSDKVDDAGGAGGLVKEAAGGLLPFGGGGGDDKGGGKGGTPGVGKGRRMPIQQAIDVAVPIETAYNQWTQYEEWAQFMHRITNVSQGDDPTTVNFSAKIWTRKRDFEAQIITQRPDERVKWRVAQGITHTGVVTFHELAPRLTRIEITMDVDPGSWIEKIARGARHIKRAARADLHRYKAFIEMLEHETGAWRGVIEDSELVEDHDPAYDEERDYADVEDLYDEAEEISGSEEDEDEDEDDDDRDDSDDSDDSDDEEQQNGNGGGRERTQRFQRQAERSRTAAASRGGSSRSASSGGGSRRSKSSSSGSSGRSKSSSSGSRSSGKPSSSGRSRSGGNAKKSGSASSSSRRKSTSRS